MPEVNAYIEQGNRVLGALGFTEHSRGHAVKVAETAGNILEKLGYNQHTIELARIAGYMHDMGNCVNRVDHAHSSASGRFRMKISQQLSVQSVSMMRQPAWPWMRYRQH